VDLEHHPSLLPWYVAGTLAPHEAALVERHVATCTVCGEEVDRLSALATELRRQPAPHPEVAELVAHADGSETLDPVRRRQIEAHVQRCAECREDVDLARALGGRRALRLPRPTWRVALVGAAATLVIGLVLPLAFRAPAEPEPLRPVRRVILEPAQRSRAEAPVLTGSGPWVLTILLPDTTPVGLQRIALQRAGSSPIAVAEVAVDDSRAFDVAVEALVDGAYEAIVEGSGARLEYPFSVDRGTARDVPP
jgi:anti-sigma factor RsiW